MSGTVRLFLESGILPHEAPAACRATSMKNHAYGADHHRLRQDVVQDTPTFSFLSRLRLPYVALMFSRYLILWRMFTIMNMRMLIMGRDRRRKTEVHCDTVILATVGGS